MKFILAVPAVFGLLAAAAASTPLSQCNTGSQKCCKNVGAAGSDPISALLKPLNIVLDNPTVIVGNLEHPHFLAAHMSSTPTPQIPEFIHSYNESRTSVT
ncbi:hypothetical protein BU17DRAFT_93945 [Hysterangium stoloniferum]|nr:hypothetical protein BU17DRAFT_93945 [Hysterangium stoloniferum]